MMVLYRQELGEHANDFSNTGSKMSLSINDTIELGSVWSKSFV
jgi:hypothetical protein